jgi:ADP-heptose:LPS heptosyltransferase
VVIDLRAPARAAGGWRLASSRGLGLVPDVARLAVLRANGIGDMLFALPALDALRAAYPAAEITLLGCPWHAEFFADRPGPIDRVVVVPFSPGVREGQPRAGAGELDAFFAAEAEYGYDLAVQLHGGGRNSNPFVRRLGARVAVGSRAADAPPLDADTPYDTFQSEVVRFLEVVSLVGAEPVTLEPSVRLRDRDRCEADALLGGVVMPVALHPGASDPRRRWPVSCFAEVGDALADAGATVLVVGGPQDAPLAAGVVAAMRAPARDLTGTLSIGGLSALLARCAVVVGNDSGPLNMAAAVAAPTVGIYWVGNVLTASPLVRSRHVPHASWRLNCPDCGADTMREGCDHRPSFVADVPAADVAASALRLLDLL